ncbi:hypothetical protein FPZ12_043325 [Amycolatopsis acidicola]|uniref:Family 43 glycosylhydrolase n=1 Tax=Amycolatopsis acidicola TaxID=2596893 RepID=A0A5N0UNK4_9PSEU|nr:hypothetical protein [Amycolatopsis acidicola]KAA9149439.1 hypothetical protein FPZ12_043325 [Amycolatopsis acidicola]
MTDPADEDGTAMPTFTRLATNPLITPDSSPRIGTNINGPSLLRVPEHVPGRLGAYYLYFAHHTGTYLRLAFADDLAGPWHVHEPGVLDLGESFFDNHLASPDVHVTPEGFRLYYHGAYNDGRPQATRVATSPDGLHFTALEPELGPAYFRAFRRDGYWYALAMPGHLYRSPSGLEPFEPGPRFLTESVRHTAIWHREHTLEVFYTEIGDAPERIKRARIHPRGDWREWTEDEPEEVLEPETAYEGADRPARPSVIGQIDERARELRDPAVLYENGTLYLAYSIAGEAGIALARATVDSP